jgi:hypothetical protein
LRNQTSSRCETRLSSASFSSLILWILTHYTRKFLPRFISLFFSLICIKPSPLFVKFFPSGSYYICLLLHKRKRSRFDVNSLCGSDILHWHRLQLNAKELFFLSCSFYFISFLLIHSTPQDSNFLLFTEIAKSKNVSFSSICFFFLALLLFLSLVSLPHQGCHVYLFCFHRQFVEN